MAYMRLYACRQTNQRTGVEAKPFTIAKQIGGAVAQNVFMT